MLLCKSFIQGIKKFSKFPRKLYSTSTLNTDFNHDLKQLNNINLFIDFYKNYQNPIEQEIDKKLLYMDYLSSYYKNNILSIAPNLKSQLYSDVLTVTIQKLNTNTHKLKSLDDIYKLSLMESLMNLNFYPDIGGDSKLWITLEYFILRTNFLENIPIENYNLILKSFQKFFVIENVTISAEEIFEKVEYQIILRLKSGLNYDKFSQDQLLSFLEIFILFAKNLEGSREMYNIFLEKILTKKNLIKLSKISINKPALIGFYFALININLVVDKKNKNVKNLLYDMDNLMVEYFRQNKIKNNIKSDDNEINKTSESVLIWCLNKRNLKFN